MQMRHAISAMFCTFNEAARIRDTLEGLVPWAEEVVVLDKGSTDGTREIAAGVSPKVRLVTIPHSHRGCEDYASLVSHARNAWVYWTTCSEVPTRRLVEAMDAILTGKGDQIDLVRVPRRLVMFGTHSIHSPWSVSYYPFLFHRDRVVFPGLLHCHFQASAEDRELRIDYSPDVCVHHFSHSSFAEYVDKSKNDATHEAANAVPSEYRRRLKEGLNTLLLSLCRERPVQIHGISYSLCNFMFCVKQYEINAGGPWKEYNQSQTREILHREWGETQISQDGAMEPGSNTAEARGWQCWLYRLLMRPMVSFMVRVACREDQSRHQAGGASAAVGVSARPH